MADRAAVSSEGCFQCLKVRFDFVRPVIGPNLAFVWQAVQFLGQENPRRLASSLTV